MSDIDTCEHGVADGDYCEPCSVAYHAARLTASDGHRTSDEMRHLGSIAARLRCEMDASIWIHVKSGEKYTIENIVWSSDSHEWIVIYRGKDRRHPAYARRLAEWRNRFRRLD